MGSRQLQAFLWQLLLPPPAITVDSKPSLSPPPPKIKCTFSLDSYFSKTTLKDKRNFSRLPVVKDNKASPWSMVKFNGRFLTRLPAPSPPPTPPQTTPVGQKGDCHEQFQIYVNLWGDGGKPQQTSELLQQPGYKYLTLFFPEEK